MEATQENSVLGTAESTTRIDLIDQLDSTTHTLRGVSTALRVLSEQSSDFEDTIEMFAGVILREAQMVNQVSQSLNRD